jgi:hypothetical protein
MSVNIEVREGDPCPSCRTALRPEACWSCAGTTGSWFFICEECGGSGRLLTCPNRAFHRPLPPHPGGTGWDYWHGPEGQFSNPFRSGK